MVTFVLTSDRMLFNVTEASMLKKKADWTDLYR